MSYIMRVILFKAIWWLAIIAIMALQYFGTWSFYHEYLEWHFIICIIATLVTAPLPIIGAVLSIIGYAHGWDLGIGTAIGMYVGLYGIGVGANVVLRLKEQYWLYKSYEDPSLR